MQKIIISQPANPEYLKDWFDYENEQVVQIYLLTIDYPPLVLSEQQSTKFFTKRQNIFCFDSASIVIKTRHRFNQAIIKTHLLIATDVIYQHDLQNLCHNLVLGGNIKMIDHLLIQTLFKNHQSFETVDFSKLMALISSSSDHNPIKAYRQANNYFKPNAFDFHHNLFKLSEHDQYVQSISKNLLIKKLVALCYANPQLVSQGGYNGNNNN